MDFWKIVLSYWGVLSLISYFQFFSDKRRAQRGQWRIPEKTLLITAGLGGAAGALLAMYQFRHKTKHRVFTIGIPLMLLLHLLLIVLVLF